MRKLGLFISILIIVSIFSMPAVAGPKGGATPAEDAQCDIFKADGVTKGLYGLCVAYCEAGAQSDSVLTNFNNKRKVEDPTMPCEVQCPCWAANSDIIKIEFGLATACSRSFDTFDTIQFFGGQIFWTGIFTPDPEVPGFCLGEGVPNMNLDDGQEVACRTILRDAQDELFGVDICPDIDLP